MFFTFKLSLLPPRGILDLRVTTRDGSYIVQAAGQEIAQLRIRHDYPTTYCRRTELGDVHMGYGPPVGSVDDEFLHIFIGRNGDVRIERDVLCTLPLFYGHSQEVFAVSNDFDAVCTAMPSLTVDFDSISGDWHKQPEDFTTQFNEVKALGEREVLSLRDGVVSMTPPHPRSWAFGSELQPTNPHDFLDALEQRCEYFFQTRLAKYPFAFEVSGGLDSSLLPLVLRRRGHREPFTGVCMVLHDPKHRTRHLTKLQAIESAASMQIGKTYIDPALDSMPALTSRTDHTFLHTMHELYESCDVRLAEMLQQQGITVVATGLGGDQLFEHYPSPAIARPRSDRLTDTPEFAGPKLKVPERYPTHSTNPMTLLADSIASESLARSNIYIEHGIWPVSPFHSVGLYTYCQALPIQYRTNKNILRAYYQAARFPEELYMGENEDFGSFFNACITTEPAAAHIREHVSNSLTHALGLADEQTVLNQYERARAENEPGDVLFSIYQWLSTEKNLRLAARQKRLVF